MSIALDLQQPDAVTATTGSVETRGDGSNVLRYMVLSALAGYVLVAPNLGVWYSTYSSHNLQRALQLVVLVAVAGYFVAAPGRFKSIIGRLPERAIAIGLGVLGLGLASSALAARPLYGLREVVLYALLTVLTLAVAEVVRIGGSGVDRALLYTFSVSALFYVALFLAIRFADGSGLPAFEARELPSFANVRFFGEFQTLLLPLLSVPLLSLQQHRAIRVLGLVTAAVGFWMLFFVSASRGAMLAIVTAAAYVLWVFGRRAVGWVAATAVSAFAGWMLFVPIVAVQPGHDTDLQKAISLGVSDTGRFDLWQTALARIANSPVLGIGPGHLAHPESGQVLQFLHPHNAILQWAAEWGLPAAVLAGALLAWATVVASRSFRSRGAGADPLAVAITASLAAAAVHSLVGGTIVMPVSQTVGAAVVGWALGLFWRRGPGGTLRHIGRPRILSAALAATIAVMLITSTIPSAPATEGGVGHAPRFWTDGIVP